MENWSKSATNTTKRPHKLSLDIWLVSLHSHDIDRLSSSLKYLFSILFSTVGQWSGSHSKIGYQASHRGKHWCFRFQVDRRRTEANRYLQHWRARYPFPWIAHRQAFPIRHWILISKIHITCPLFCPVFGTRGKLNKISFHSACTARTNPFLLSLSVATHLTVSADPKYNPPCLKHTTSKIDTVKWTYFMATNGMRPIINIEMIITVQLQHFEA